MNVFKRLGRFITTVFIGGIGVIFPVVVLFFFFGWLFRIISTAILPITMQINQWLNISVSLASILSIVVILTSCFFIGLFVKTKTGHFVHNKLEKYFLSRIPGYRLLREAAKPFFNPEKSVIFTKPVLIRPYANDTWMTAFITDHHTPSKTYTAFVPTSPNPTNGLVFHVPEDRVQFLDSSFEEIMRSVVAGGSGSAVLLEKIRPSAETEE
ncbi:MAG: DUF502 domain-containing protein [Salinispira sp.]